MSTRISLPRLKIATPCPARWEDMRGDDRKRFCDGCGKHVHNFAAMREEEIAALLTGPSVCGRIYRRTDGTILTADCSVGIRLARTRIGMLVLRAAAASIALLATAAAALGSKSTGDRIASCGTAISNLQTRGIASLGDVGPAATQPVAGEIVALPRPTLGIVAPPATQPSTQPSSD